MLERIRFRRWWQLPRSATTQHDDRRVSFLELFYDLIYVAIIAELAHSLAAHVTLATIGTFAFLFTLVWWAWLNGTTYHDLHGNNDIRTRVFTFLQMFTVAAMAVFAHNAMGEGSAGFALSYAAFHLILTYLWWRTGVHEPVHRPLTQPFIITFLITTILFIISVFVPTPWRFYLWSLGLLMDLIIPFVSMSRSDARIQEELARISFASPSIVERFGLFIIIVLGEVIVGVLGGVAEHHHLNWLVGGTAGLGMIIAFGLWWLYFDLVSHRAPKADWQTSFIWMYLHLPMAIGISAAGAAILNVVEHAGESLPAEVRWLLVGAIGMTLIGISLIMLTLNYAEAMRAFFRRDSILIFVFGALALGLGYTHLDTVSLLLALIGLLLIPVLYAIVVWIRVFDIQEVET